MKNKILIASALAITLLASCSKSLILSDGQNMKKIKVASQIETKRDLDNNTIMSFESAKGTKYTFNASNYTYVIK